MTAEELVRLATQTGIDAYRKERDGDRKAAMDSRLKNTKLLLENYRNIKASVSDSVTYAEDSETAMEVLQELMVGKGTFFSDSIRLSAAKSAILLDHIDSMLKVYRERCMASSNPGVQRRWQIIEALYVEGEENSMDDIAEKLYVGTRQLYEDKKRAITEISILFFGVSALGIS